MSYFVPLPSSPHILLSICLLAASSEAVLTKGMSPKASSLFTPGAEGIAVDLGTPPAWGGAGHDDETTTKQRSSTSSTFATDLGKPRDFGTGTSHEVKQETFAIEEATPPSWGTDQKKEEAAAITDQEKPKLPAGRHFLRHFGPPSQAEKEQRTDAERTSSTSSLPLDFETFLQQIREVQWTFLLLIFIFGFVVALLHQQRKRERAELENFLAEGFPKKNHRLTADNDQLGYLYKARALDAEREQNEEESVGYQRVQQQQQQQVSGPPLWATSPADFPSYWQ